MSLAVLPCELISLVISFAAAKQDGSIEAILAQVSKLFNHVVISQRQGQFNSKLKICNFVSSIPLLEWARNNGCPWNHWVCSFAAGTGKLDVLKWARANSCPWGSYTCTEAARNGHLEIMQWANENGCYRDDYNSWRFAAVRGDIEMLQWLKDTNTYADYCDWDYLSIPVINIASERGNLKLMKWARENGYSWKSSETASLAAKNGHIEILEWLRENDYPLEWSQDICRSAAGNNQLGVLKWARTNAHPWNTTAYSCMAFGHFDVLQWAIRNGCPFRRDYLHARLLMIGRPDVAAWLLEQPDNAEEYTSD